ncbi:acetyl-CoA C-acetyltransferase [uncultured Brevundimonas sp.]|uniref:acetyl-CoA C-acetyltransferase n=1 Tax=uncultured Brevundimonas sp. TaxID=213418 RepID=UPI00260EEDD4|nr:acetyl-CoA C-acetyltransferase [uncultured Brevundimonas sp.]
MGEALIIDAVRTPRGIGKPGKGALSHLHPTHLGATVLKAIAERNKLDTATVDDVIISTSTQRGKQGGDLARMAALAAGYDTKASGVTLDRFCGGGITAVAQAAAAVASGFEDCVVAGGVEMMSYTAQLAAEDQAHGVPPQLMGSGYEELDKLHPQSHQGVCGDAIAAIEGIPREALDALALVSQQRADRAIKEGRFNKSLVPVLNTDGSVALDHEEFPRPSTTAEGLAALKGSFGALANWDQGNGVTFASQIKRRYPDVEIEPVHHAGNSSGVVDGAAALLITSPEYAAKNGLKARGRVVTYVNVGDDPTLMLNAPVPAAKKALAKAGLTVADIDVWEINEAFAVVAEKFIRDLGLDREKVNINGGAMALGHPIGATGSMLIGTALDELERSNGRYALITMCAAGGMAPAIIIERV